MAAKKPPAKPVSKPRAAKPAPVAADPKPITFVPSPKGPKLTAAMRAKAVAMCGTGAPHRLIAMALGFSMREFNGWMSVGRQEDEAEQNENPPSVLAMERVEALAMYRELHAAEARYAVSVCKRMAAKINKGDMLSAQWWLARRVPEFGAKVEVADKTAGVQVIFTVPDNGRMPK